MPNFAEGERAVLTAGNLEHSGRVTRHPHPLSFRPSSQEPKATESEWRNPENVSQTTPRQGVLSEPSSDRAQTTTYEVRESSPAPAGASGWVRAFRPDFAEGAAPVEEYDGVSRYFASTKGRTMPTITDFKCVDAEELDIP